MCSSDLSDSVDHRVGFSDVCGIGARVGPDAPIAMVHAASEEKAAQAHQALRHAIAVGGTADEPGAMVLKTVPEATAT